jgi:hypothetical protein
MLARIGIFSDKPTYQDQMQLTRHSSRGRQVKWQPSLGVPRTSAGQRRVPPIGRQALWGFCLVRGNAYLCLMATRRRFSTSAFDFFALLIS